MLWERTSHSICLREERQGQARQEEANIAIAETNFAETRNQIRFEVEQGFPTCKLIWRIYRRPLLV